MKLLVSLLIPILGQTIPQLRSSDRDITGLSLRTQWGSEETLSVYTRSIFAIWWDPAYNHDADAVSLVDRLEIVRDDCLDNLEMEDPPNPGQGYFYNVYIHHQGAEVDPFPDGWALGQGTDKYGTPYLTVPKGSVNSASIYHEGFHIFQYQANSPGFAYSGDTQWYIESSAQWYMAGYELKGTNTYLEAGAIMGNPQLALWHSFNNEAPNDPGASDGRAGWMYGVRQYGMHTYLRYLTEVAGVNPDVLTGGFYAETSLSPQEYIYSMVGPELTRKNFADWAAHTSANMDYLTREQYERGLLEITYAGDWNYFRPSVVQLTDSGTSGDWVRPPAELTARGWAYNVFNITTTIPAKYTFALSGDPQGSQGAPSHFQGRLVVMRGDEAAAFQDMAMGDPLTGSAEVTVTSQDTALYLVVASVPEYFSSYQTYGYEVMIGVEFD